MIESERHLDFGSRAEAIGEFAEAEGANLVATGVTDSGVAA